MKKEIGQPVLSDRAESAQQRSRVMEATNQAFSDCDYYAPAAVNHTQYVAHSTASTSVSSSPSSITNSSTFSAYNPSTAPSSPPQSHYTLSLFGTMPAVSSVHPGQSVGLMMTDRYDMEVVNTFCILDVFQGRGCCPAPGTMDYRTWYEHVISHFGTRGPPNYALCGFCNREFMDDVGDDARRCWNEHLFHVYNDHMGPNHVGPANLQPDYKTLDYLRQIGRVSKDEYTRYCADRGHYV